MTRKELKAKYRKYIFEEDYNKLKKIIIRTRRKIDTDDRLEMENICLYIDFLEKIALGGK